jgi:hypothetical protein
MDIAEYMNAAIPPGLEATAALVAAAATKKVYNKLRSMDPIKKNRRLIRLNTGETKCIQWSINALVGPGAVNVTYLTNIIQGDDHDERIGRRIRVMGYSYTLHGNDRNLDIFVLKTRENTAIAIGGFINVVEGGVQWDEHNEWKTLQNVKSYTSNSTHYKGGKRFKNGMLVHYNGTAANNVAGPALHLVAKNSTGAAIAFTGDIKLYYRDA